MPSRAWVNQTHLFLLGSVARFGTFHYPFEGEPVPLWNRQTHTHTTKKNRRQYPLLNRIHRRWRKRRSSGRRPRPPWWAASRAGANSCWPVTGKQGCKILRSLLVWMCDKRRPPCSNFFCSKILGADSCVSQLPHVWVCSKPEHNRHLGFLSLSWCFFGYCRILGVNLVYLFDLNSA